MFDDTTSNVVLVIMLFLMVMMMLLIAKISADNRKLEKGLQDRAARRIITNGDSASANHFQV